MKSIFVFAIVSVFIILACNSKGDNRPQQANWLAGSENTKEELLEKHLRGFDIAMMEVDYRYQELYWAGQDQNWEYAQYQLSKIKLAIELALEKRPLRKKSAAYFLENDLPEMLRTVETQDSAIFNKQFEIFTTACNACHNKEKLDYFFVSKPTIRRSSIFKN